MSSLSNETSINNPNYSWTTSGTTTFVSEILFGTADEVITPLSTFGIKDDVKECTHLLEKPLLTHMKTSVTKASEAMFNVVLVPGERQLSKKTKDLVNKIEKVITAEFAEDDKTVIVGFQDCRYT